MSDLKPAFVDLFEAVAHTIHTLSAQELPPIPLSATPEAKQIIAAEVLEKYGRMVSLLRDASRDMSRGLETLKDLALSREPDVERYALAIWSTGAARTPQDAFKAAEGFVQLRNARRSAK
jgi:hypothetical protein